MSPVAYAEDILYGPSPKERMHQYAAPEERQWKELALELPPYPDPARLRGGELVITGAELTYQLDVDSIRVDADEVVRYAIVIISSTGARNVFYEGIRCQTAEYKSYAYGSQGQWSTAVYPRWQSIGRSGSSSHRRELFLYYFCNKYYRPVTREEVLARLINPYRIEGGRP